VRTYFEQLDGFRKGEIVSVNDYNPTGRWKIVKLWTTWWANRMMLHLAEIVATEPGAYPRYNWHVGMRKDSIATAHLRKIFVPAKRLPFLDESEMLTVVPAPTPVRDGGL
jgi:hypothetical protein